MTQTLDDIRNRESQHVLQTYRRQPVAFVRGRGSYLYDADGRERAEGKDRQGHVDVSDWAPPVRGVFPRGHDGAIVLGRPWGRREAAP